MLKFIVAGFLGTALPGGGKGSGAAGFELAASSPSSLFPLPSSHQAPAPKPDAPGSELTVYLVTMGYGDPIWSRFGHNAIRIVDASRGTDSVYNWGTFDFDQPNFLRRFMTGNTLYWMQADGMAETIAHYRYLNRSVWAQELDLTLPERVAIRDFITWNAQPENRYYRYDYYLDNCSTRVRDLIDRIVGGQLKAATAGRLTNTTYRFHTQRSFQWDRLVALGTNIGLGEVADRPISQWEESFLPARLQEHVRPVQIRRADGSTRSLVKSEQQLFAATRPPEPTEPPNTLFRNLAIGLVIAAIFAVLARGARAGSRAASKTFATLASIWAAINGILGVVLIVGWTATRHVFMVRNENLLQFNPLALVLAVVLPLAILRGRATNLARVFSLVVAAIAVLGLVMKAVPLFNQINVAVIALTLPAHLAIAWAIRMLTPATSSAPNTPHAARAAMSRSAA